MLKEHLPEEMYVPFMRLVSAFTTSMDTSISARDLSGLKSDIIDFIYHYEETYYQYKWERLAACTSQIHFLAHIPDIIEWLGSVWSYWQYPMKRICSILAKAVASRVQANRNMSLNILRIEQLNHLRYMAQDFNLSLTYDDITDDDSDHRENFDRGLLHIFIKRMQDKGPSLDPRGRGEEFDDYVLTGRSCRKLSTRERILIKEWYISNRVDLQIHQVPTSEICTWSQLRLSRHQVVRSAQSERSNATRCASYVHYHAEESNDSQQDSQGTPHVQFVSQYGYVRSFIMVEIPVHHIDVDDSYNLAIIQKVLVYSDDGNLLMVDRLGSLLVIENSDIQELVGVMKRGDEEYIVGQYTAFML